MHAQSNQVLTDRKPAGLGVVAAGIALAASVAVGAVIGVNLAAKANPFGGGYHLITPSAAVDQPEAAIAAAKAGAVKPIDVMPKSEAGPLPRNPGDIIYAPSIGGTVTGPSYDNQSYLLLPKSAIGGSTFLDGADQRHEQSVAANAALMATLREAARLHGAPLVDSAARLEAQSVAVDAAIMQGLREAARLHGAPISDPVALRQAQAVSIEAQINAGLRQAANSAAILTPNFFNGASYLGRTPTRAVADPLSLFASPYFGRVPTSAVTSDELIRMAIAASAQRANATASFPMGSSTATYSQATDSLTGDPKTDVSNHRVNGRATRSPR